MQLYCCALYGVRKITKYWRIFILYGPFKIGKKHASQSNYFFDNKLRIQNEVWGIRNLEEVSHEGKKKWFYSIKYF